MVVTSGCKVNGMDFSYCQLTSHVIVCGIAQSMEAAYRIVNNMDIHVEHMILLHMRILCAVQRVSLYWGGTRWAAPVLTRGERVASLTLNLFQ